MRVLYSFSKYLTHFSLCQTLCQTLGHVGKTVSKSCLRGASLLGGRQRVKENVEDVTPGSVTAVKEMRSRGWSPAGAEVGFLVG